MTNHEDRPALPKALYSCLLGLVLALFVGLRLWNLAAACLDGDEAFSFLAAADGWSGLWERAAADISHPPLFYALLKLWMLLGGESLLWLRLLPVLLSLTAVVPLHRICRERRLGPFVTLLALFFWATNGSLIYYAQHVRDFILLQSLSLWSLWLLQRCYGEAEPRRRTLLALAAVNLLGIYAHYWAWILVATELLVLVVLRRRWVPFLLASALLFPLYAPWAHAVFEAAATKGTATAQIGWIARPKFFELVWFVCTMNGVQSIARSAFLGLALFGAPIALWCVAAARGRARDGAARPEHLVALLLLASIPAIVTFVASHALPQSVWGTRHLLPSVVPYFLLVAIGTVRLLPARAALAVALAAWSLVAGIRSIRTECVKMPMDRLFAMVVAREAAEGGGGGDVLLVADDTYFVFSAELHLTRRFGERFRYATLARFEDVEPDRFWVIYRETAERKAPPVRETLARAGYRCGEESSIEGWMRVAAFPVRR